MRVKQPKPTKKRSDFSDESDQSGEEEEEEDGEDVTEKMPEEEEEDELMEDVVGVAEVPQPTSSESLPVGLNRTQLLDSLNPSTATTSTFPPGRQPAPRSSAQLEFDTQSIAGMTQLEEVDADPTSLSGIGDMPSSYEQPSQLQFEMTQLDTYADREESASHRDTIGKRMLYSLFDLHSLNSFHDLQLDNFQTSLTNRIQLPVQSSLLQDESCVAFLLHLRHRTLQQHFATRHGQQSRTTIMRIRFDLDRSSLRLPLQFQLL